MRTGQTLAHTDYSHAGRELGALGWSRLVLGASLLWLVLATCMACNSERRKFGADPNTGGQPNLEEAGIDESQEQTHPRDTDTDTDTDVDADTPPVSSETCSSSDTECSESTPTCDGEPCTPCECEAVECPADDVCRDFPPEIAAGSCDALGACPTVEDCNHEWKTAARDGDACECNDDGCSLSPAETCTRDLDCASGDCAPTALGHTLCCAVPCEVGEICSDDGTECIAEPACEAPSERCNGDLETCRDGQWQLVEACDDLGCDLARGGCLSAPGDSCRSSDECAGNAQCQPTSTGSMVCCEVDCSGACKACAASGRACDPLPDDDACAIACPADTPCRDYESSVLTNRCVNGACGTHALCEFTPRGEGQSCGDGYLCDDRGNCSIARRPLGETCTNSTQCASGYCVDGVCCDSSCSGPCMACRPGTGLCDVVPADDDLCPDVTCSANSECAMVSSLTSNLCSGLGQCKTEADCSPTFQPAGTTCQTNISPYYRCDGKGDCRAITIACGSQTCLVNSATDRCCLGSNIYPELQPSCSDDGYCDDYSSLASCDDTADCPSGEVCCVVANGPVVIASCSAASQCNTSNMMGPTSREICFSPGMSSERACPSGWSCNSFNSIGFDGWKACFPN